MNRQLFPQNDIANRVVSDREEALNERMGLPPHHVGEDA